MSEDWVNGLVTESSKHKDPSSIPRTQLKPQTWQCVPVVSVLRRQRQEDPGACRRARLLDWWITSSVKKKV